MRLNNTHYISNMLKINIYIPDIDVDEKIQMLQEVCNLHLTSFILLTLLSFSYVTGILQMHNI